MIYSSDIEYRMRARKAEALGHVLTFCGVPVPARVVADPSVVNLATLDWERVLPVRIGRTSIPNVKRAVE